MPGFIITESSTLVCPHASGTARALLTDAHVKISGSAIMTVQLPYQIDHCGNTNAPCVTASWIVGAGRVQEVKPAGALSPILVQGTVSAS
jgi:hypothetical protein